eukprot:m.55269 g.55269  ORF g.55269 m.55269 type:complete len:63 (-) comp9242_c0_seq2:2328-2516(-)
MLFIFPSNQDHRKLWCMESWDRHHYRSPHRKTATSFAGTETSTDIKSLTEGTHLVEVCLRKS